MEKKKNGMYRMVLAVVVIAILLLAAYVFIEKGNEKIREEAKVVADAFSEAYFSGDLDGVKAYLAEPFEREVDCWESDEVEIIRVKGLENINLFNMRKRCHFSVEVVLPNDDSLSYLETDIVREKSEWKIISYGLEK